MQLPLVLCNLYSPALSASGSYGRLAGWLAGRQNTGEFQNF